MSFWKKLVAFVADDAEADDPHEAVRIFSDSSKSEGSRRAQLDIVRSLSDRLGSGHESDPNTKARVVTSWTNLLRCLSEPTPWVRAGALQGLQEIAGVFRYDIDPALLARGVPAIVECTRDPNAEVRSKASWAASSIVDVVDDGAKAQLVSAIAALTSDVDEEVRGNAVFNLGSAGEAARAHAAQVRVWLADPSAKVRSSAASAAWMIDPAAATPPVVERLLELLRTDRDEGVRESAADALGKVAGDAAPTAAHALLAALEDPSSDVRHKALFALGELGDQAAIAVPRLIALLDHEEHGEAAQYGLRGIGTADAVSALRARGVSLD